MPTQSRWVDDHAGIVALVVFVVVVVLFVLLVANMPSCSSEPDWATGKSWCDSQGGVWTQLKDGSWFCFGA